MKDEPVPRRRGRPRGEGPRQQEAVRVGEAMAARLEAALDAMRTEVIEDVRALRASVDRRSDERAERAQTTDSGTSNLVQHEKEEGTLARVDALAVTLRQVLAGIGQIQDVVHATSRSEERSNGNVARMIDDLRTSVIGDLTNAGLSADQRHEELRDALLQQGARGQAANEAAASNAAALTALDQHHRRAAETVAQIPTRDDLKSAVAHAVGMAELGAVQRHDEILRTVAQRDVEHSADKRIAYIVARALATPGLKEQLTGKMLKTIAASAPEILAQSAADRSKAAQAVLDGGIQVESYVTPASDPAAFAVARYHLSGEVVVSEKADGALDVLIGNYLVTQTRINHSPSLREAAQAAVAAVYRYKAEAVAHEAARTATASKGLLPPQNQPAPLEVADPQKRGVGPHFRAQGELTAGRPGRRPSFTPPLRRT